MLAEIPLETVRKQRRVRRAEDFGLTGDVGAGGELGRHLGVHGDHDLLLLRHDGISILDLLLNPFLEA